MSQDVRVMFREGWQGPNCDSDTFYRKRGGEKRAAFAVDQALTAMNELATISQVCFLAQTLDAKPIGMAVDNVLDRSRYIQNALDSLAWEAAQERGFP